MPARRPIARFETVQAVRGAVASWRARGEGVVLVPTMGALHAGHLALMEEARRRGGRVVASLFVNPTQFGPNEDFSRYPRDVAADVGLLEGAGVDAVYLPTTQAMYGPGFSTSVAVAGLTEGLCGAFRPGHFAGVATVVTKLVNRVGPDVALFGEKDFQQLQVIRRAIRDLDIPVEIGAVPTLREADGLALSSRNRYLGEDERRAAPELHRVLSRVADGLRAGGLAAPLVAQGLADLTAAGFAPVQYLAVCDAGTLRPVAARDPEGRPLRVLAAAYLGRTRLIDNVPAG